MVLFYKIDFVQEFDCYLYFLIKKYDAWFCSEEGITIHTLPAMWKSILFPLILLVIGSNPFPFDRYKKIFQGYINLHFSAS